MHSIEKLEKVNTLLKEEIKALKAENNFLCKQLREKGSMELDGANNDDIEKMDSGAEQRASEAEFLMHKYIF